MFASDLQEAHTAELAAIPYLEHFAKGSRAWPNKEPFKYDCDLFWLWKDAPYPSGVEVKHDKLATSTHRIAIEHKSIGNSTCEFALYLISGQYWLITMSDLKDLMKRYPITRGGDQINNYLTLVPERYFFCQAIHLPKH